MSAQTAVKPDLVMNVQRRLIVDKELAKFDVDPRLIRWGYNPGLRGLHKPTHRTGQQQSEIPVGEFFPLALFSSPREYFTIDENKDRETVGTTTAHEAELEILESLKDWGYQRMLIGVNDVALVKVINKAVLPTISEILDLFPDGPLKGPCKATDELDLDMTREQCATCHLEWLKSEECELYLEAVAAQGSNVRILVQKIDGTVAIEDVFVEPKLEQLLEVRDICKKGLALYIRKASESWSQTVSEIEDKLRNKVAGDEHFYRKDLHKRTPDAKGLDVVDRMGEVIGEKLTRPQQQQQPQQAAPFDMAQMATLMGNAMAQAMSQMQAQAAPISTGVAENSPNSASPLEAETEATETPVAPTTNTRRR
jgi:hypothetical protein